MAPVVVLRGIDRLHGCISNRAVDGSIRAAIDLASPPWQRAINTILTNPIPGKPEAT
jgi:hypothetical protein